MEQIIQDYGILPSFAFMAILLGLYSAHLGQLLAVSAIICGVYATILKVFEINLGPGVLDFPLYVRITGDQGDILTGSMIIFIIGIAAYTVTHFRLFQPIED